MSSVGCEGLPGVSADSQRLDVTLADVLGAQLGSPRRAYFLSPDLPGDGPWRYGRPVLRYRVPLPTQSLVGLAL